MKHIHTLPPILLIGLLLTLSSLPTVQAATNNCAVGIGTTPLKRGAIPTTLCSLLTVTKTGSGTLTLQTSNITIKCGGTTCKSNYAINSTVTLTATSTNGSIFMGWGGDCMGTTANATVIMDAAKTCTANFLPLCNTITQIPQTQCDTLVALYNNTDGTNWTDKTGWTQTNTPCSWKGITCNSGNVTNISLASNNLKGSLPDLGALTGLQTLFLNGNQLSGGIPDLSHLTSLGGLDLNNNQLNGSIPNLSNLSNLSWLDLSNNQISGEIPDLSKQMAFSILNLTNNQLSGPIPSLPLVALLDLSNNPQLCKDPNANYGGRTEVDSFPVCSFSCNNVTEIPKAQCDTLVALYDSTGGDNWTSKTGWKETNTPCSWEGIISCWDDNVTDINLAGNNLKGSLPDLSALTGLHVLDLSANQLTGAIPDLTNLTSLSELYLSNNQLTGAISNFSSLTLWELDLSNNQLTGTLPKNQIAANLDLSYNQLTGTLPNWVGDCGAGEVGNCYLNDNQLSGPIPWLGSGGNMLDINLDNNPLLCVETNECETPFSGEESGGLEEHWHCAALPSNVPLCSSLITTKSPEDSFCAQVTEIPKAQCQILLAIYDNTQGDQWTHQDGWNTTTTPCQWYGVECTIGQVTALRLANNNLQGTLPTLTALTSLKQLAVENNLLEGTLPGLPTAVEIFTGDRNQLSGPLTVVQTLTQLRQLNLGDNQLSDALPDLSLLTRLEILNLNNNQLAGPIPDLRKLTQLKQLLLKDNHLAGAIPALTVADTLDLSGNDQLCRDINITYTQTALNAYSPCTYPTLTVAKIGNGIGLVSATSPTDQDKLNCGLECLQTDQTYSPDSNVTLTATPTEGTVFTGWSGECSGETGTITVTLDQAKTCVANFEIQTGYYELQVSKTGIGKGTVTTPNKNDPFHCDTKCQETRGTYPANTQVKLRTNASKGSEFTGWGGACSGTDQQFTLTMDQAKSCYANFNLKEPPPPAMRQLIINTDAGNGKGTVTTDREDTERQGIDCGIDCLENYQNGKHVKLTATPLPGSSFLGWEDDCSGKDPTLTVKMTDNKLCTAIFANDIEMNAAETVNDFYANGYLDTGEEVQDRYPRYPNNDQRLREAFLLAQPAILTVDLQVDLDNLEATWPIQFNDGMSFFRLQPATMYTESVKILKDAIVEGYLSPAQVMGYYVEVRVKLLNYLGVEEWVPILIYYGEPPQGSGVKAGDRDVRQLTKNGIAIYKKPPPPCPSCGKPK